MSTSEPIESGEKLVQDPKTGKFLPGHPPTGGRPKGTFSIKSRIIQRLEENPGELKSVIDYLITHERALLFQMIDGRPQQDVTSGGEKLPQPLLVNIYDHNDSNKEDSKAPEEN